MFGGIAFMIGANMCCGVIGKDLMLRLGPDGVEAALEDPHARPMDFTGKPLKAFIYVAPAGVTMEAELRHWIDKALGFVTRPPPKR